MNSPTLPTDILSREHEAVLKKLDALERCINHLDEKEEIAAELRELITFFNADFWVHFDKEERAFFPEFDNFMPRGVGPLAAMRDEHELLRNTEEMLAEAVAAYLDNGDSVRTRQSILQYGAHFIGMLKSHITKENGLLPTLAEMHLGPGQNDRILRLFIELEKAAGGATGE